MEVAPYTREAHDLFLQGSLALARIEAAGMAVDTAYIVEAKAKIKNRITELETELANNEVTKTWQKFYKHRANTQSPDQLAHVLYDLMGFTPVGVTASGHRGKVDEDSLVTIDHPFIRAYLEVKKLKKAAGTNIRALEREVVDGKVHCFFNLNNVISFRSSSDKFNFQNIPKHDIQIANLIRRAFVARKGRQIVEVDFKGAEVCVGACYHKDPSMIRYILDPDSDMHRDAARQLFFMPEAKFPSDKYPKIVRQLGKGFFVFAEFYGDWYKSCANSLWREMLVQKPTLKDGTLLMDHLRSNGIRERGVLDPDADPVPGTFEAHVQGVERWLWQDRFPGYAQWKRDNYAAYHKQGWFLSHTGFVYTGYMRRNEVNNYGTQGSAFHCLLWGLVRLVMHLMPKYGMRSTAVGQIHDSIVFDVVPEELDDLLALCRKVYTKLLLREHPWIIVPITIDADVCPVGGSWVDKQTYKWN
jgi:DNA polymerase I-like protein with 3'-5' exonuclease and polymerase domains